jgi:XTP/dITP diphosphohydrolase
VKLYVITTNAFKVAEIKDYAARRDIASTHALQLWFVRHDIQEILHPDIEVIVRQKAVDAYAYVRRPCLVEHGGLFLDALPGLPGGVGRIMWSAIGDRMCGFLRETDSHEATGRSFVAFCDGRHVRVYLGETRGRITDHARGAYNYGWDPIFVPERSEATYGELGLEGKRETSPVAKAWDKLLEAERAHFLMNRQL